MNKENYDAGFAIMYTVCSLICLGCVFNADFTDCTNKGDGVIACMILAMLTFMVFAIYHSGRINNR